MVERRNHPRATTNLKATFEFGKVESLRNGSGFIKDIGIGGARLQLNGSTKIEDLLGQSLDVLLPLKQRESPLKERARIAWTNPETSELGIQFTNITPATQQEIRRFFFPPSSLPAKIPHNSKLDYDPNFISLRREWLESITDTKLHHISHSSQPTQDFKGNIEQYIGVTQIPIGITGPLKINGRHAKGKFYVPLATTEGALAMTYNRGMRVLSEAGGVRTQIIDDQIHISPAFTVPFGKSSEFIHWINENFLNIKLEAEKTTHHGKLLKIEPESFVKDIILKFIYFSADAHGLNMINKASEAACKFIQAETGYSYRLRSNYSSIKKVSSSNMQKGYGKRVVAEAILPPQALKLVKCSPARLVDYFFYGTLAGIEAGMIGNNCHISNGIAAIFLACGQDAADISTSHIGTFQCQLLKEDHVYVSVHLPNVLIGTVGGGTNLGTQKECLKILGCFGKGKSKKLAEIIAATALAGEIAVLAALATDSYVQAHEKYGRNKPKP